MEWFQDQLSLQLEQKSKQGLLPLKNRINFKILRRTLITDLFGFLLLDSFQLPRLIDSAAQVISSHWNLIAPIANTATSIINSTSVRCHLWWTFEWRTDFIGHPEPSSAA